MHDKLLFLLPFLQNKSVPHSSINTLYLSCLNLFHFMQMNFTRPGKHHATSDLIHINRIINPVSIIHAPFYCHNSSVPYLQGGREGGGRKTKKKRTEKATKCKSFPLLTYHFPTKPFHHSIVSLQIFAVWFFSMAFGYGIKQVN